MFRKGVCSYLLLSTLNAPLGLGKMVSPSTKTFYVPITVECTNLGLTPTASSMAFARAAACGR